jgi:hypothetical protein
MGGAITTAQIDAWKTLLREGRVTEADVQLEAARVALLSAEQEAKMKTPAGEPMSAEELTLAFQTELCAQLGNPPRLYALLVEIVGRAAKTG